MPVLTRIPGAFTTSFSEGLRVATTDGAWIFISGVVGMPMQPSDPKPEFVRVGGESLLRPQGCARVANSATRGSTTPLVL